MTSIVLIACSPQINHSSFQKQRFKFFIGDRSYEMLKQELNLNEYLPEKMNELNVTGSETLSRLNIKMRIIYLLLTHYMVHLEKSGSSHESVSTTSENMEEKEYITNQAVLLGFIRDKFVQWLSFISDDILETQTLEYWLLSYVSEMETNIWNENISPSAWLSSCFAITPETADTIVNSVSEGFLQNQTPQYWINEWISQQTNPLSCEFNSFIESAPENTLVSYGGLPNLFVVNKIPANGDDEELNLLLSEKSYQSSDNHTYYFHTTDRRSSESIIKDGIDVSKCHGNQDFGRSASFHLNDEFRWAAEWGRKRFLNPNSCVILVYDIPAELLLKHDHLDLSQDLEKWKRVVRNSRDGKFNEADDHFSVYGPQAENVNILIKNKRATPRPSSSKNQLALKEYTRSILVNSYEERQGEYMKLQKKYLSFCTLHCNGVSIISCMQMHGSIKQRPNNCRVYFSSFSLRSGIFWIRFFYTSSLRKMVAVVTQIMISIFIDNVED
uniref:Uncharacterized protein n=1 Tax=Rhizophagus irregularis (strain DAOM 181602 / DAOM 197198 / MUCL 43194) TaxID=747089 RepID=U9TR69_RHIID